MITRKIEEKLKELVNLFPVIVILGPRQVGKTTLAKKISPFIQKECIHLDLERPDDLRVLEESAGVYLDQNKEKCIIIDEVQRLPSLFPRLRPIIDEYRKPARFILLGSASPTILKESSESLAGRVIYIELTPFNILEVSPKYDMMSLWLKGGFPEPFLMEKHTHTKIWYSSFLSTYFERDLPLLGLKTPNKVLARLFAMLSHMQGNLCNISALSKALGVDRRTIDRIIHFLISSYIVREVSPFHVNNKKRLIKTPKYYIRDSGIFHHTLNINKFDELWSHPSVGASWESFVIEQIISLGLDFSPYFYRTRAGSECDLVLVQGNSPRVCIEAKINESPKITKSLANSINDLDTKENFIVIPSADHPYPLKNNITVCGLPWLLSYLSEKY